jgi:hypothetical protein
MQSVFWPAARSPFAGQTTDPLLAARDRLQSRLRRNRETARPAFRGKTHKLMQLDAKGLGDEIEIAQADLNLPVSTSAR